MSRPRIRFEATEVTEVADLLSPYGGGLLDPYAALDALEAPPRELLEDEAEDDALDLGGRSAATPPSNTFGGVETMRVPKNTWITTSKSNCYTPNKLQSPESTVFRGCSARHAVPAASREPQCRVGGACARRLQFLGAESRVKKDDTRRTQRSPKVCGPPARAGSMYGVTPVTPVTPRSTR